MGDWISVISSLGFPIAACCYLGWFTTRTIREFQAVLDSNTDAIRELTIYIKEIYGHGSGKNDMGQTL